MSRKLMTVAALAALILPVVPSSARAQFSYGVAAGATVARGHLSPVDAGYHAMASLSFLPPLAPIGFRLDGMYSEFNYKSPFTGSKAKNLAATANAVIASPGVAGPYLIGGLGLYRLSISPAPLTGASGQTDVGGNIGAGFRIALAGFSAFAEARYHFISSGSSNYQLIPITIGVTF